MARATYADAQTFIVNALNSAGGSLPRTALDQRLNDAGVSEYMQHYRQLAAQGAVKKRVVAQEDGPPILYYYLP